MSMINPSGKTPPPCPLSIHCYLSHLVLEFVVTRLIYLFVKVGSVLFVYLVCFVRALVLP
jgi:hypothetical protein